MAPSSFKGNIDPMEKLKWINEIEKFFK